MAQRLPIEYVQFYTLGTAAQKVEVAKPKLAEPVFLPPVIQKRKRVFVDPVAIFGVIVAGLKRCFKARQVTPDKL